MGIISGKMGCIFLSDPRQISHTRGVVAPDDKDSP